MEENRDQGWTTANLQALCPLQATSASTRPGAVWGTRGPEFKSRRPDMRKALCLRGFLYSLAPGTSVAVAESLP